LASLAHALLESLVPPRCHPSPPHRPTSPTHPHPHPHPVGYTRYLLDTLAKRELLTWLQLAPQRWWAVLHYADEFNYGGVEASVSAELWEAGGVVPAAAATPGPDGSSSGPDGATGEAAASAAAAAEIDEAEIGTPGGPRLR
jgi:hypothetical protein